MNVTVETVTVGNIHRLFFRKSVWTCMDPYVYLFMYLLDLGPGGELAPEENMAI